MNHKPYEKVERLAKEDCEGLLDGKVHIFEKLDGTNGVIWCGDDEICYGSKSQKLTEENSNRGFFNCLPPKHPLGELLRDLKYVYVFGEWLVKHTVQYPDSCYKKFYVFDIFDGRTFRFFTYEELSKLCEGLKIKEYSLENKDVVQLITPLSIMTNPTQIMIEEQIGRSKIVPHGEGIVLKNYNFINKFGRCIYGKLVDEKFKEVAHKPKKLKSHIVTEEWLADKYCTEARARKIWAKYAMDNIKDPKEIPMLSGYAFKDTVEEEIFSMIKDVKETPINFRNLQRAITKKVRDFILK